MDPYQKIIDGLRGEYLDDALHGLAGLEENLRSVVLYEKTSEETMPEFLGAIHNLKGTSGSFGFPLVTNICHHFEDYLEQMPIGQLGTNPDVAEYLDTLSKIIDVGEEPDDKDAKKLLGNLPVFANDRGHAALHNLIETSVVLVVGSKTIRHKIRGDLSEMGFKVTSLSSGLEAIRLIQTSQPDIIIVSRTIEEMDGFDLVKALSVMEASKKSDIVVMSSFGPDHSEIRALPTGIPCIRIGPNVKSELHIALTSLEFRDIEASPDAALALRKRLIK